MRQKMGTCLHGRILGHEYGPQQLQVERLEPGQLEAGTDRSLMHLWYRKGYILQDLSQDRSERRRAQ